MGRTSVLRAGDTHTHTSSMEVFPRLLFVLHDRVEVVRSSQVVRLLDPEVVLPSCAGREECVESPSENHPDTRVCVCAAARTWNDVFTQNADV